MQQHLACLYTLCSVLLHAVSCKAGLHEQYSHWYSQTAVSLVQKQGTRVGKRALFALRPWQANLSAHNAHAIRWQSTAFFQSDFRLLTTYCTQLALPSLHC